ncbi:hypothetical protein JNUCC64_07285 [Streptomyces sp. JNUCC 64]
MGSKYNDPSSEVEQYSYEYLQSLKAEGKHEEISQLHAAGHFRLAIEERAATRAENRSYSRQKGVQAAGSIKAFTDKLEADQAASEADKEAKRKEALTQLRRLGINPEDLL